MDLLRLPPELRVELELGRWRDDPAEDFPRLAEPRLLCFTASCPRP